MKVSTRDSAGAFLMTEASDIPRGGFVPRHVHFEQDEWFYAIKGEFVVAVGGEMFQLHAGDLVFAPRNVSHTWARVGDTPNTLLVGLFPVLKFERFLERLGALSKPLEGEALEKLYADHGMKIVGPPLDVR